MKENHIYKSRRRYQLIIDSLAIILSFLCSYEIRGVLLKYVFGEVYDWNTYIIYMMIAVLIFFLIFFWTRRDHLEKMSSKEIAFLNLEKQSIFVMLYVFLCYLMKMSGEISRLFIILLFCTNTCFVTAGEVAYHRYCLYRNRQLADHAKVAEEIDVDDNISAKGVSLRHVYIVGAKSIGQYGGYESFVMNLLQGHKDRDNVMYHVACKANGDGCVDFNKLPGAERINENEFIYYGAHAFLIKVPTLFGSAQAIYYDLAALKWVCNHIRNNHIESPIVYLLASRVGPFEARYAERIHQAGGLLYQNPDGHEDRRRKWNYLIRKYWKFSESRAVKHADLVICDSKAIQTYIREEYSSYKPKTSYISYGSYVTPSKLEDQDPAYCQWLRQHDLEAGEYYMCVGRFVPENNYDIIIREFMASHSKRDLAIITTKNETYMAELRDKYQFQEDSRIKFVGTVYDADLLAKIREKACGNFHGHEVGGTNPSLLEAMGRTKVNLLLDVEFNREVGQEAALYWNKTEGNLAALIDQADAMTSEEIETMGRAAKDRIREDYRWEDICDRYAETFGL